MKLFTQIILLTIIDYLSIWYLVKIIDPDPSASIIILFLVPLIVGINLIIALILAYTKQKYIKLFVINSIIAGIIMFYLFNLGVSRHQNLRYNGWNFNIKDTTFELTINKLDTTFSMTYSLNPGSSNGYLNGTYKTNKKEFLLIADKKNFIIRNNYLFAFRQKPDSIKLTHIER